MEYITWKNKYVEFEKIYTFLHLENIYIYILFITGRHNLTMVKFIFDFLHDPFSIQTLKLKLVYLVISSASPLKSGSTSLNKAIYKFI